LISKEILTHYRPVMQFRKRKIYFRVFFSVQYCHNLKKTHPSGNPKFNNLGLFQSLKLRISMEKNPLISLKLNFTP